MTDLEQDFEAAQAAAMRAYIKLVEHLRSL